MSCGQPARHLQQQAPRTEEHGRRELHASHEFQLLVKALREFNPCVRFGSQAVRLVEGAEQLRVETTAHATPGQRADLAKRLATQADQRRAMSGNRGQCLERQAVEHLLQGLGESIGSTGPGNGHGGEAGWGPGKLSNAEVGTLLADALHEFALPAEEASAGLDLHHDGRRLRKRFDDCDARCELKAPGRESRRRLSAP